VKSDRSPFSTGTNSPNNASSPREGGPPKPPRTPAFQEPSVPHSRERTLSIALSEVEGARPEHRRRRDLRLGILPLQGGTARTFRPSHALSNGGYPLSAFPITQIHSQVPQPGILFRFDAGRPRTHPRRSLVSASPSGINEWLGSHLYGGSPIQFLQMLARQELRVPRPSLLGRDGTSFLPVTCIAKRRVPTFSFPRSPGMTTGTHP
jgi:hypothetical protein